MTEDIGDVEAAAAAVAVGDDGLLGGPAGAIEITSASLAKVPRIFAVDNREEAARKETHGGLPQKRGADAVGEGTAVGTVLWRVGELAISGGDNGWKSGRHAGFLVQPKLHLIFGGKPGNMFAGIDVLGPFALLVGRLIDRAGGSGFWFAGLDRLVRRLRRGWWSTVVLDDCGLGRVGQFRKRLRVRNCRGEKKPWQEQAAFQDGVRVFQKAPVFNRLEERFPVWDVLDSVLLVRHTGSDDN